MGAVRRQGRTQWVMRGMVESDGTWDMMGEHGGTCGIIGDRVEPGSI